MRDLMLQAAGLLAIVTAVAHGVIAEWRIFAKVQIQPAGMRTLLRMVWQASTVDWIGVGILMIATPYLNSEITRRWVIALAVLVYGFAAICNAVATRGRHVGWLMMAGVVALSLLSL